MKSLYLKMNPTNQYQSPVSQADLSQMITEGQAIQFPKIDHILAHAKNPELSYIYARPELQTSASATANVPQEPTLKKTESSTPKKGRPRDKSKLEGGEKKQGTKIRKSEIYDKYYLDNTRMKKNQSFKKV